MNIGIDISQIVYEGTGSARYTQGMLEAIAEYGEQHTWHFFFASLRKPLPPFVKKLVKRKNITLKQTPIPPKALHYLWNRYHKVDLSTLTGKLDWFITSDWTQPPSRNIKVATLVHDLAFKRFPQAVPPLVRDAQELRLSHAVHESALLLTLSDATTLDLLEYYPAAASRQMTTLYPGVNVEKQDDETCKKTLVKYQINGRYILTVGKIEPRKNLKSLIQAFSQISEGDVTLVIVGPQGWEQIDTNLHPHIRFTGYVSDKELYALYQSALFFVFPSIWEGFGYPLVEAMALSCPTAASNTSSLKEIGKDAAYMFDPHNIESIERAINKMMSDDQLRTELIEKGLKRAQSFSQKAYYHNLITALT